MGLGQGEGRDPNRGSGQRGYAMAALLIGLSVMAVLMGAALPVWSQQMKREREEELIWRGTQYARAVGLFQRKYANAFPPTIDVLVEQRFLRKKYKDPITNDDFQPIPAGGGTPGQGGVPMPPGGPQAVPAPQQQGRGGRQTGLSFPTPPSGFQQTPTMGQGPGPSIGIQGVVSKSKDSSIKIYNGRTKYNEWAFVYLATAQRIGPGAPGSQQGGFPGGTQRPGGFGPPGLQPGGRPPVPFPTGPGGSGFPPPPPPSGFGQPSPFSPPTPMGTPPPPFGNPRPPVSRPPG
jgi:type II secretory pathway pseudopilin PulG